MATFTTLLKAILAVKGFVHEGNELGGKDDGVKDVVLDVRPYKRLADLCPCCGRKCPRYDNGNTGERRKWRAPDWSGLQVYLRAQTHRGSRPVHGAVTAAVPWAFFSRFLVYQGVRLHGFLACGPETRPFELFRHFMVGKRPGGTLVDIELQISGFPFNPREAIRRSLFCWFQDFGSRQLGPGRTFPAMRPSVMITLMREKCFNDEAYRHRLRIAESRTSELLTDDLQMHFIELVKWKNLPKRPETQLECRLDHFTNKTPCF